MTASIRTVLESLVSPQVLLPESELERFRTGPGEEGLPAAVLAPGAEEELAALLARASEEGWKVLPAGLGQWLEGGGPAEVQLVVSTRRLQKVHEYNPADLTFTAGAGLTLSALRGTTEPNGQWLPLNPPGGWEGTLGAALATGVGGSLRHLYGTARDHVLGLTLVAGDGRILRWGGKVVKNVAGFDVTRLCLGSWGSLGLITSVSARLFPVPEKDATLVFSGSDIRALLSAARAMALSSLPLASVEVLDPRSLCPLDEDAILESVKKTHRLVIVHEEVKFAGSGAEIAATVAEKAFDYLDAPILRVAAPFCPVPFSGKLEAEFVPSEEKITDAVKAVMEG